MPPILDLPLLEKIASGAALTSGVGRTADMLRLNALLMAAGRRPMRARAWLLEAGSRQCSSPHPPGWRASPTAI
jgi:hypothetical protein